MPRPFDLPDYGTMRRNLQDTLVHATPAEQDTGEVWYDTAHTFAVGLAERYGLTVVQGAGIIAALSPGCDWRRNMALAERMCATGDCRHPFGQAIRKARAIWTGAPPSRTLGGDKVTSFYCNILRPDYPGPVTVDRHAVSCLVGRKVEGVPSRKGYYQRLADVFRDEAAARNELPSTTQAIAWLAYRRLHPAPRWAGRTRMESHPQLNLEV